MYTYIDLFAGCGGLSDGFEQSGFYKGLAHVEWEKIAAKSLINRLEKKWQITDADKKVLCFDVQKTKELINGWNDEKYGQSFGLKECLGRYKKIDVLIGGPPCQAYSLAGRIRDHKGMQDDYRNYLFESYVQIMKWANPDIFVFENVVGVLSAAPGGMSIIERIQNAFKSVGYTTLHNLKEAVFHLNEFGVPQKRNRVIIIGLNNESFKRKKYPIEKLLSDFYYDFKETYQVEKQVTSSEALNGLTKFKPKFNYDNEFVNYEPTSSSFLNHKPRYHSPRDIETFRLLTTDLEQGNNIYTSIDSIKDLYTSRTGKKSSVHKYYVIRPNEPSNTIPAHLYKDGLRHIHWDSEQSRTLTVREAARLQTFDDDYEFLGSMGDQYKMIGNAVPPMFAKKLSIALKDLLSKKG